MGKARELDATRLVTFVAALGIQGHQAFDEANYVAVNLYHGSIHGGIAHRIDENDARPRIPTEQQLRTMTDQVGDKPVLVTEFGNIGIQGLRGAVHCTEDHQAA